MPESPNAATLQRLRRAIAARLTQLTELTRRLVETESPSGDLAGSRAVVDALVERAENIRSLTRIERVASPDYGEHLRLEFFGDSNGQAATTLVLGHTDTVYPRGTLAERQWRVEGERIYGPGIFDMKINCALALEAIAALDETFGGGAGAAPFPPAVLLLTCDEEDGSETGRALVEEEAARADRVLVLEPSAPGGRVKTGRKGTGWWTVRAAGRAAHAGLEPEKGVNAIVEIARQVERLHALADHARGTTVNVGVIGGGTTSNVVPAEAFVEIDVRYSSAAEAARLNEAMNSLRPFDERVRLSVEGQINRPPLERTAAVVSLYEDARRIARVLGAELGETQVGGASDGNFAAALCPAVLDGLGVEGDGAHATHEHVVTTRLAERGALLAGLIARL